MNNYFEIIEKDKLIQELKHIFSHFDLPETPLVAESLEVFLQNYALTALKQYSLLLLGIKYNEDGDYLTLENGKVLLSVSVGEDMKNRGTLYVVIDPHIMEPTTKKEFNIGISSYGNINDIVLVYPDLLPVKLEAINSLLKNIFEVGYHWFGLRIAELSSHERIALIQDLYNYAKSIITSDDLRKHLWFATVTDGYGFRLIELDVSMALFSEIAPNASRFGFSTNRLVAEMLSTKLPEENLLMPKALAQNSVIDVNISDAKYSKDGDIYAGAMSAFYGCDSFTIQPISIQKTTGIVALYPTDKRKFLEPILQGHISQIQDVCLASTSKVKAALKLFEKQSSGNSRWGRFVGGVLRGFLDT